VERCYDLLRELSRRVRDRYGSPGARREALLRAGRPPLRLRCRGRGGSLPGGARRGRARHRELMQEEAFRIRDATADAPRGVERVQVFDRVTHDCHDAPAQVYRVYGEGVCAEALPDNTVAVHYPFRLLYRKAERVEELFAVLGRGHRRQVQVRFERREEGGFPSASARSWTSAAGGGRSLGEAGPPESITLRNHRSKYLPTVR